jgi:hypothetical protein
MHGQSAFEFLPLQLELPSQDLGDDRRHRGNRRAAWRSARKNQMVRPRQTTRWKNESAPRAARVLRKQCGSDVKRVQNSALRLVVRSLDDNFPGHLRMDRAEVRIFSRFGEREGKLLVRIEHLGLEYFVGANDCVRDVVAISPDNGCSRRDRDGRRAKNEIVNLHLGRRSRFLLRAGRKAFSVPQRFRPGPSPPSSSRSL